MAELNITIKKSKIFNSERLIDKDECPWYVDEECVLLAYTDLPSCTFKARDETTTLQNTLCVSNWSAGFCPLKNYDTIHVKIEE